MVDIFLGGGYHYFLNGVLKNLMLRGEGGGLCEKNAAVSDGRDE